MTQLLQMTFAFTYAASLYWPLTIPIKIIKFSLLLSHF